MFWKTAADYQSDEGTLLDPEVIFRKGAVFDTEEKNIAQRDLLLLPFWGKKEFSFFFRGQLVSSRVFPPFPSCSTGSDHERIRR